MSKDYAEALFHHMMATILYGDNDAAAGQAHKAAYYAQQAASLVGAKTQIDMTWPKAKQGA